MVNKELQNILQLLVSGEAANVELALNLMLTQIDRATLLEVTKDICTDLIDKDQVGQMIDYLEKSIIPDSSVIESIIAYTNIIHTSLELQKNKHPSYLSGLDKILKNIHYYCTTNDSFDFSELKNLEMATINSYCDSFVESLYSAKYIEDLTVMSVNIGFDERLLDLSKLKTLRVGRSYNNNHLPSKILDQKTLDVIFSSDSIEVLYIDYVDFNGFELPKKIGKNIKEFKIANSIGIDQVDLGIFSSNKDTVVFLDNMPDLKVIGAAEFNKNKNRLYITNQ